MSLGNNRFFDPRSKQSFKYDHLRKDASDYQPYGPDAASEPWRQALDTEFVQYARNHYRDGVCGVYGRSQSPGVIALTACVEDHQFQPKNFWNGRWRSQWFVVLNGGSSAELRGILKVGLFIFSIMFISLHHNNNRHVYVYPATKVGGPKTYVFLTLVRCLYCVGRIKNA